VSDQELIGKYKETGRLIYVQDVYIPYIELIYGLCLKYLQDVSESQDAVQDIFLLVSSKLKKHEVENFKPWLYKLSVNHCLGILRKKNRALKLEIVTPDVYFDTEEHLNLEEQEMAMLKQCIERLSENQKTVIEQFYFQERSYQLIAESLNCTWNEVRSFIQNGRRNLKNCIEDKNKSIHE